MNAQAWFLSFWLERGVLSSHRISTPWMRTSGVLLQHRRHRHTGNPRHRHDPLAQRAECGEVGGADGEHGIHRPGDVIAGFHFRQAGEAGEQAVARAAFDADEEVGARAGEIHRVSGVDGEALDDAVALEAGQPVLHRAA